MLGPSRLPTASFTSPFVAPRTPSLDLAAAVLALLVFALATSLLVLRLHRVSAPARGVRSVEAVVWSLASACVEAGALLGVAQVAVVLLLAVGHPAVVVAEGVACQIYVSGVSVSCVFVPGRCHLQGCHRHCASSYRVWLSCTRGFVAWDLEARTTSPRLSCFWLVYRVPRSWASASTFLVTVVL